MQKKLSLVGCFSIIFILGFVIVGCTVEYTNSFFIHGPWFTQVMHDVNADGVREIIDLKAEFTETTFMVSATYEGAPVDGYGFSGEYTVTGLGFADLQNIVGLSSSSGTADIRFVLQYGESLVLEIGLGRYIFPKN
jgi:hypothetical protein